MRRFLPLVLAGVLAGCQDTPEPLSPERSNASLLTSGLGTQVAPGRYVVVFRDGVADAPALARQMIGAHGGTLQFVYEHALKGFSAELPDAAVAALQRNPNVAYIEHDRLRHVFAQKTPTGVRRIFADRNAGIDIDGTDDHRVDVDVAIIDTGIDYQHPDLQVVGGVDCSGGSPMRGSCTDGGDDDHYHGTHVAGTVAALDNGIGVVGVAPGARLWAVKVLNSQGSGYTSWIVAGIDWVAANANTIEVANMSLGGSGFSQAEYDAIQGAVNKGVAFAVAAGNSDDDASKYSPAAFDNVLSVSALADFNGLEGGGAAPTCRNDQDDTLADFSNWGSAVDIAAPGVCITSTYPIEQGEYGTISGTSMASPHVAGALALLASKGRATNASEVHDLYTQVKNAGNFGWTDDSGDGVQEPLLDVRNTTLFAPKLVPTSSGGGDGGTTLSASFTYTCSGTKCTFDGRGSSGAATYAWDFTDNGSTDATTAVADYTYPSATATYTARLTVDDNDSATSPATTTQTISCSKKGKNWTCK